IALSALSTRVAAACGSTRSDHSTVLTVPMAAPQSRAVRHRAYDVDRPWRARGLVLREHGYDDRRGWASQSHLAAGAGVGVRVEVAHPAVVDEVVMRLFD